MHTPFEPLLPYFGGKSRLAQQIVDLMPPHQVYVDAFGGAANILIAKPPSEHEIYNDLNGEVVNLFRVLRDEAQRDQLIAEIESTPYARETLVEALAARRPGDGVPIAVNLLVRSYMGYGTDSAQRQNCSFRADTTAKMPRLWRGVPERIARVGMRFRDVTIENTDALSLVSRHLTNRDALLYLDPPYMPDTRQLRHASHNHYAHELSTEQHASLLELAVKAAAKVMVSGYESDLYAEKLTGWKRIDFGAQTHGGARRESLWLSPHCQCRKQQNLF